MPKGQARHFDINLQYCNLVKPTKTFLPDNSILENEKFRLHSVRHTQHVVSNPY